MKILKQNFLGTLAGSLLVAHPKLTDPNFARSVILLSSQNPNLGSLGVIINHPLNMTVGQYDPSLENSPLSKIPLFDGGPNERSKIILTAWQWLENNTIFKFHFGISEQKALELLQIDPSIDMRAFIGYSAWNKGQLESELQQHSWFISSVKSMTKNFPPKNLWSHIIKEISPQFSLLGDIPDDPSLN